MFLRSQVDQFDDFHKKKEKYAAVDAETISNEHTDAAKGSRHTTTVPSPGLTHAIILGAKQPPVAIGELVKTGATFTVSSSGV